MKGNAWRKFLAKRDMSRGLTPGTSIVLTCASTGTCGWRVLEHKNTVINKEGCDKCVRWGIAEGALYPSKFPGVSEECPGT